MVFERGKSIGATTYGAVCDSAFYDGFGFGVHGYLAGAIDHSIADYGLGEDGERGWGGGGVDSGSGGHGCWVRGFDGRKRGGRLVVLFECVWVYVEGLYLANYR